MSKELSIGIVGSGFAANFHYDAVRNVKGVPFEIVGVYSPTPPNQGKGREKSDGESQLSARTKIAHAGSNGSI